MLACIRVASAFYLDQGHSVRLLHLIIRLLLQLLESIARIVDRRTIEPTGDDSLLAISIENCLDHRVAITCKPLFEHRTDIRLCHTCNFWCQNKGEVLASPIQHAKSRETANILVRCLSCHTRTSGLVFLEVLNELYCATRSSDRDARGRFQGRHCIVPGAAVDSRLFSIPKTSSSMFPKLNIISCWVSWS